MLYKHSKHFIETIIKIYSNQLVTYQMFTNNIQENYIMFLIPDFIRYTNKLSMHYNWELGIPSLQFTVSLYPFQLFCKEWETLMHGHSAWIPCTVDTLVGGWEILDWFITSRSEILHAILVSGNGTLFASWRSRVRIPMRLMNVCLSWEIVNW